MDTCRVFMFILMILFPVLGQISDNNLDDALFVGDQNFGAICRMRININDSCVYIELPGYAYTTDIDYDRVEDTLYWINWNSEIVSAQLSGESKITMTTLNDYGYIYGIAVDSISRLLFYTSSSYVSSGDGFIAVVGLDDFLHKPIISGLVNPRGIALDIIHGTIYWADSGSPAKIEKSNYDGTNRQELVNSGLMSPYGIDVDVNAGILYWCDIQTIERVNVDGSNRSIIYQMSYAGYYGCSIALYQSYLYFTQQYRYQLMRIGTDGGGLVSIDSAEGTSTRAIHVNTEELLGTNECSNVNGGCSHFCFPLPGGNKMCACPNLMTLQPDGQTCQQDTLPEVLLISYHYHGFLSGEDIRENYTHFFIPLPHRVSVYDMDYDRTTDDIYWVQANNQIYSSKIFGKKDTTSQSMNSNAQIYGIATDSISRLLFYTDRGNDVIAVISLQDFSQKTIISSGLGNPADIIADPINGIIYWVDTGTPAKIEKSNYDGSNRQDVVVTDLTSPYDLYLDFEAGLLYWCEINNFRIKRSNLDGSNRSTIYQEQGSFSGCSLVFYQSFIFFTRWWSSYDIMRIGTDGSGLTIIAPYVRLYPMAIHVTINGSLGNNKCSNGSDGCSHFCFPMPDGNHVCDCPKFMSLQPDRKTCQLDTIPDTFLLITVESNPYIYRMDIRNYSYVMIPAQTGYYRPHAIDYDPNTALMFWTVLYSPQIFSRSIYGNNQTTLLYGERSENKYNINSFIHTPSL